MYDRPSARIVIWSVVLVFATLVSLPASAQPAPPHPDELEQSDDASQPAEPDVADEEPTQELREQPDVDVSESADAHRAPEALLFVGRVFTGGLFSLLAAAGGVFVGGVGGGGDGYDMLIGASLAIPAGYYLGAGLPGGRGRLLHTYAGALGAYILAGVLSMSDPDALFLAIPLTFVGSSIGNELSHAHARDVDAAAANADTPTAFIGTGPGDVGLSFGFSF